MTLTLQSQISPWKRRKHQPKAPNFGVGIRLVFSGGWVSPSVFWKNRRNLGRSSEILWLHQEIIEFFSFFVFKHFEVHRFCHSCSGYETCNILDCWIVCLGTTCPGIAILYCICQIQLFYKLFTNYFLRDFLTLKRLRIWSKQLQ